MAITNKKMPASPTVADLADVFNMLNELNHEIRSRINPDTRKEADRQLVRISSLAATCRQLGNDAKDPGYFKSRMGAATDFYKTYNIAVDEYKAKLAEVKIAERPSSPKKITISGDESKFKKACGLASDFEDLIAEMKKADNYAPTTVEGQFSPRFNKHEAHVSGKGNEWKAYVEKGTKNTKWRLYFTTNFKKEDETLEIKLTKCQQDH